MKTGNRLLGRRPAALSVTDITKEIETFIMRGNVIDMAVGVIVGAAFQAIVNSLVNDVISPVLGLFANMDLSYLVLRINDVEIRYGAFLTAVINFLIMAFVIFLLVKAINKISELGFKRKKDEEPAKPIPADAVKCSHCTSDLPTEELTPQTESD